MARAIDKPSVEFAGVLVGWEARGLGERLVLHLQGVTGTAPHDREDVSDLYLALDRTQAMQLGENLFGVVDATMPERPRRSWLRRALRA